MRREELLWAVRTQQDLRECALSDPSKCVNEWSYYRDILLNREAGGGPGIESVVETASEGSGVMGSGGGGERNFLYGNDGNGGAISR